MRSTLRIPSTITNQLPPSQAFESTTTNKKAIVRFNANIQVIYTHSNSDYDRRGYPVPSEEEIQKASAEVNLDAGCDTGYKKRKNNYEGGKLKDEMKSKIKELLKWVDEKYIEIVLVEKGKDVRAEMMDGMN